MERSGAAAGMPFTKWFVEHGAMTHLTKILFLGGGFSGVLMLAALLAANMPIYIMALMAMMCCSQVATWWERRVRARARRAAEEWGV